MTRQQSIAAAAADDVWAGQEVYTASSLRLYDALVLGFSNRFCWGCPTAELLALYDAKVSANHLDAGVATGYFLDNCRFPAAAPRLGLLDLNPLCLEAAAARVARYRPQTFCADVLAPLDIEAPRFDSLGITYLLHCLPGTMPRKAAAFGHLKPLLNPGATVFGATILGQGAAHNWLGRRLLNLYNAKGIFGNLEDDLDGLRLGLECHFSDVELCRHGVVALFTARS